MHLLYVVEFDVESTGESEPFARLIALTAEWLSRGSSRILSPSELASTGEADLPPRIGAFAATDRAAVWEHVRVDSAEALRLSVQQQLDSGVELTTRLTITSTADKVTFRVGLSREYIGGALAPVQDTGVYQPGIIEAAARDEQIRLHVGSQHIDERFQMVKTSQEAAELVMALRSPSRLPILLVHCRTIGGRDAAYFASRKLVGLARVVTVNFATRDAVQRALPNIVVPFGGARLVWSNFAARAVDVTAAQIAAHGREHLRDVLMPRLAPISALVRGVDEAWRLVRLAVQRAARADTNARIHVAQQTADTAAERDALSEKVALLEGELAEVQELAESYARDVEALEAKASAGEDAQAQADYWKALHLGQYDPPEEVESDPWEAIPALKSGEDPSDTFLALTDASDSCIVFTESAERSWQKIAYPDPEDMTESLMTLARAAAMLYGDDPGTIGHIGDWFKTTFGINVATSDDTIEKTKALRDFEYEGKSWNQKNHVKVRDAVKPNEVGRIHFAFDSDGKRLIVNHVALKLYGI